MSRPVLKLHPSLLLLLLLLAGAGAGCEPPTPPGKADAQYSDLLRVVAAEAKAHPDSSFFWLRNADNPRARTLMLDLGIDYLHYNRAQGVLCVWNGEGLWPARGYVTAMPAATPQTDSVGMVCNIEGDCSAAAVTETWARFRCE